MNLGEIKQEVLSLIEEYDTDNNTNFTNDPDIQKKLNRIINNIQVDLCKIKRISEEIEFDTELEGHVMDLPDDLYKIDKILECDYEIRGKKLYFDKNYKGIITVYYHKYPEKITENTKNNHEMELARDALACLVYGVASAILKADISANYSVYEYKYQEMKAELTNAKTDGVISFSGGW